MDFLVAIKDLNWWAVFVSLVAVIAFGGLWYSNLVFGKPWVAAVGKTKIELQQGRTMLWLVATTLFWSACLVITIALIEHFIGINGWQNGLTIGLLVGFGIAIACSNMHALLENRFNSLVWITASHNLIICVIAAVILAVWR